MAWREITADQALYQFAAAEVDSARWKFEYQLKIGPDQAERLRALPIGAWTETDCAAAVAGVKAVRPGYVGPLLATKPAWFETILPVARLAQIRVIRMGAFLAISPDRSLHGFVRGLDQGKDTPGDGFAAGYRALRPNFDPGRMRGWPVVVGATREGPFTEAEGLTRMCCLLSRHLKGEPVPATFDLVVGVSPRIVEWGFF